jgi:hypothetical protein
VPPAPSSVLRAPGTDRTLDRIVRQIRGIRVHRRLLPAFSLVTAVMMGVCARAQAKTFTVTSAADAGAATLRDAITQANDETNNPGLDTIDFAIPGTGVPNIALTTLLPEITSTVIIDGTTQGAGLVEISGGGTLDGGLLLSGGSSTVSGLVLNRFVTYGIQLTAGGTNIVTGCIVGLDPTGTAKAGADMLRGIWVNDSPGNVIGGTTKGAGNVLSGNANGVAIETAGSTGNTVQGNVIGLGSDGSIIQNSKSGVRIALGATATVVGSTSPSGVGRNVISGNVIGVSLRDAASQSNKVEGNYIGTDATGTEARPNGTGILISEANGNTIGGQPTGSGNVVSGNTGVGIDVQGVIQGGNKIYGNLVGTTAKGTAPLPNASGIRLLNCTAANHVGTSGGGNVISGNTGNGVNINKSNNQFVQGNVIGTSRDGSTAIPNGLNGVQVAGSDTTIGGGVPNLIASNTRSGVLIISGVGNTRHRSGRQRLPPQRPARCRQRPERPPELPRPDPARAGGRDVDRGHARQHRVDDVHRRGVLQRGVSRRQRSGRDVPRHPPGDDGRLRPRELLAPPDEPAGGGADPHGDGDRSGRQHVGVLLLHRSRGRDGDDHHQHHDTAAPHEYDRDGDDHHRARPADDHRARRRERHVDDGAAGQRQLPGRHQLHGARVPPRRARRRHTRRPGSGTRVGPHPEAARACSQRDAWRRYHVLPGQAASDARATEAGTPAGDGRQGAARAAAGHGGTRGHSTRR